MDQIRSTTHQEPHRYLSAPWRMKYLTDGSRAAGCVLCAAAEQVDDAESLVLWREASIFVMMNLYPYSTGHIMIAPYDHVASPEQIDPAIMAEIGALIPSVMRALRRVLNCQGFNSGINTGATAGAGIADHMHLHIVPRWNGDANFMPIIANVTVMPEAVSITYAKLRAELVAEIDPEMSLVQLVLSADQSRLYFVERDGELQLPSVASVGEGSVVARMAAELAADGITTALSHWAGDNSLVWQASEGADPVRGAWVDIDGLPPEQQSLVLTGLAR
jgi:ATP adenylyltransferase